VVCYDQLMKAVAFAAAIIGIAGCVDDDSTDIAGDYFGNLTYVATGNLAGASSADVIVTDADDGESVALAAGCTVDSLLRGTLTIEDHGTAERFVLSSDDLAVGQPCTAPIEGGSATFSITEGTLVVEHGGTMQLQLGGNLATPATGYIAYSFQGALR